MDILGNTRGSHEVFLRKEGYYQTNGPSVIEDLILSWDRQIRWGKNDNIKSIGQCQPTIFSLVPYGILRLGSRKYLFFSIKNSKKQHIH